MLPKVGASSGSESPRVAIPSAIVRVLSALIEDLPDVPSSTRVELRSIRSRLCRIFQLPDPAHAVGEVEMAQLNAEDDGEAIQDGP